MPNKGQPKSLAAALTDVPNPPCLKCSLFTVCADQELACDTFRAYVVGSWQRETLKFEPKRVPSRHIFDVIKAGRENRP